MPGRPPESTWSERRMAPNLAPEPKPGLTMPMHGTHNRVPVPGVEHQAVSNTTWRTDRGVPSGIAIDVAIVRER